MTSIDKIGAIGNSPEDNQPRGVQKQEETKESIFVKLKKLTKDNSPVKDNPENTEQEKLRHVSEFEERNDITLQRLEPNPREFEERFGVSLRDSTPNGTANISEQEEPSIVDGFNQRYGANMQILNPNAREIEESSSVQKKEPRFTLPSNKMPQGVVKYNNATIEVRRKPGTGPSWAESGVPGVGKPIFIAEEYQIFVDGEWQTVEQRLKPGTGNENSSKRFFNQGSSPVCQVLINGEWVDVNFKDMPQANFK